MKVLKFLLLAMIVLGPTLSVRAGDIGLGKNTVPEGKVYVRVGDTAYFYMYVQNIIVPTLTVNYAYDIFAQGTTCEQTVNPIPGGTVDGNPVTLPVTLGPVGDPNSKLEYYISFDITADCVTLDPNTFQPIVQNVFYAGGVNNKTTPENASGAADIKLFILNTATDVDITANPNNAVFPYETTLTVTEKNIGLDPLSDQLKDVTVTVSSVPSVTGLPTVLSYPPDGDDGNGDPNLDVGETWTWTLTGIPISELTHFTAIGSATDKGGSIVTWCEDPNAPPENTFCSQEELATVDCNGTTPPEIGVTKRVDCEVTMPGYPVYYEICIQNDGNVPVIPTLIYDDKLGDLTADFVANCTIPLPPDANCCRTFGPYYEVLGDPNTNTVTFDANDLLGNAAPTAYANATVTIVDPNFTVEKICLTNPVEDANACFRIIITNIGDVNLVVITDEPTLPGEWPLPAGGEPIDVNICVPVPPDVNEVCNTITVEATIDEPNYICLDGLVLPPKDANDCCPVRPPGGDEGCTPGFWKNNADKHDASAWCDLFDPNMHISDIFDLDEDLVIFNGGNPNKSTSYITDPTLLEALGANGGGVNAMIRHGIAAMLNACSDCVNYPDNAPFEIIMMIQDALNGEPGAFTVDELHSMFAGWNEAGCPVNQHGECSHELLNFMD